MNDEQLTRASYDLVRIYHQLEETESLINETLKKMTTYEKMEISIKMLKLIHEHY